MSSEKQQLLSIINDVVKEKHDKYAKYDDVLDGKFYHDLIRNLRDLDINNIEMNETIYYGFVAERYIFDKLCELAKTNDNIALDIIQSKMQTMSIITRKMGLFNVIDLESTLYDAIMSYDLNGDFDKYLVSYVRNIKNNNDKSLTKKF